MHVAASVTYEMFNYLYKGFKATGKFDVACEHPTRSDLWYV